MGHLRALGPLALAFLSFTAAAQQDRVPPSPITVTTIGRDQTAATKVADNIYQAVGFGNTFLVTTPAGNVIIDTSVPFNAALHTKLLRAVSDAPIKYIILTHAHGDHTGGVEAWKKFGALTCRSSRSVTTSSFSTIRRGSRASTIRRNAAQFGRAMGAGATGASPGNYAAKIEPTILFDDKYEFELGGVKFEVLQHARRNARSRDRLDSPDEGRFHRRQLLRLVSEHLHAARHAAAVGARLRELAQQGARARTRDRAAEPRPGHPGQRDEIDKRVTRYRDAIQYVHDETVKGMNAGKDVWTLMREIKLPAALDIGESYGKLSWSVRGIYEGYVGWFDLNPATMYETPVPAIYPDLVQLAGGPDAIAKLARERAAAGRSVEALHLSDVALAADANHRVALEAKLAALEHLRKECKNSNERGWLDFSIASVQGKLGK